MINMKYYVDETARKASNHTNYVEFQIGPFNDEFWKEDSIMMHGDIFNSIGMNQLFYDIIPNFDYYDNTEVSKAVWQEVYSEGIKSSDELKEAIQELDSWVQKCFEQYDVFTIAGL